MKKLLSFILSFVLILEIMSFTQAYALSPDLAEVASFDDNAILDEYSYYFNVPSRDIYQLSQEELNLPTEELVDLILDYPYLVDFISASNPNETYQYIRNSFNGFAELETRTDATTILLSKLLSENDSYPNGSIYKLYVSSILSIPFLIKKLPERVSAEFLRLHSCFGRRSVARLLCISRCTLSDTKRNTKSL